jgi:cathepsin F
MNRFIIALIAILAVSHATFLKEDSDMLSFIKFIKEHNKEYASVEEFNSKFEIFRQNLAHVEHTESFSPFMDVHQDEFSTKLNLDASALAGLRASMNQYKLKNENIVVEDSLDWRTKGAVSPVKNQGQCGSCWAFSAVGNLEGLNFIKHGQLVTFSEQQLVDCDHNGDQGCNGGLMDNAFQYLISNGGIETDKDYPYTGKGGACKVDKTKQVLKVVSFEDISKNEEEIAKVLQEVGPLSVAVNATPFQFYAGGILKPTKTSCNPARLNHGVTLVGLGEENGVKFWIIKNSWGSGWGEKGYIRLQRGTGACGVNTAVSTARVA